ALDALKAKTYAEQKKRVEKLLNKIQDQGLDNWPMILESNGLVFAPGIVAWPKGNNSFDVQKGFLLQCLLNGGPTPDGFIREIFGGALKLDQLNESSTQSIIERKKGERVYVSLPPKTFTFRQAPSPDLLFGAGPNYVGNTVLAIYHHGENEGKIDLCYTPYLLAIQEPNFLRITRQRDSNGFKKLTESYRQHIEKNNQRAQEEKQRRINAALNKISGAIYKKFQQNQKFSSGTEYDFAHELRGRIKDRTMHTLVIEDIVWAEQTLKELEIPATELLKDPRIAYVAAAAPVEKDYRKKMSKFWPEHNTDLYRMVRYGAALDKYLIQEEDLKFIKGIVQAGYRPRRPYEQGFVPTKEYVEMCGKIFGTLKQESRDVLVLDSKGSAAKWNEEHSKVVPLVEKSTTDGRRAPRRRVR
ncbi:MAG: hypothetical protein KDA84_12345, partial [Planctomycetaceae bacterium]|nr:hypothetical protein [Planctomycetaceae bacterium]